jgi:hypothetical protein
MMSLTLFNLIKLKSEDSEFDKAQQELLDIALLLGKKYCHTPFEIRQDTILEHLDVPQYLIAIEGKCVDDTETKSYQIVFNLVVSVKEGDFRNKVCVIYEPDKVYGKSIVYFYDCSRFYFNLPEVVKNWKLISGIKNEIN